MAVTKTRKAIKRSRSTSATADADARAGASSSMSMAPPPGLGGLNELQQPPPLPPGVYFNPTHTESIGFLNRWIAGDDKMPDVRGFILHADMYDNDPYALQRMHPPASARAGEHTWWFLGESKFQSPCSATENKRADRSVRTGGFWRVEQSKEELPEGGLKNCFGFHCVPPPSKKPKTPWLMQEFTSDMDRGAGRRGVPALHKLYVTPRPEGLREIYGEDGLTAGNKKTVPADYFAAAAALMPPGSVRGLRQEHVEPPQPQASELPPSPPPLLDYGDDGQSFMKGIMSSVGLLHYDDSEMRQDFMGAATPANVLGQYQQQHMGLPPPLPPPAPPGLHDEDAPEDNSSMPMDQFMKIFDEPAPAETVRGEEPAWDSLPDIVDHDEFLKFNKDA